MTWKHNSSYSRKSHLSLDCVISRATANVYGETLAALMCPNVLPIQLPSGRKCHIVTFDVAAMIFDILNDGATKHHCNTIFSKGNNNPLHIDFGSSYNDVESSTVYEMTYRKLRIDPMKEVLCPVGLYLDELKLDAFGKLGLEPVVLTLLILNRETRNKPTSHRVIGYMPNFGNLFGDKSYTADDRANDYHQCLSVILKGLKSLQSRDGFFWNFRFNEYPNQVFKRKLKFPLFYVIGDAKGHDMLAGRFGSRTGTKCIARDCDVLLSLCDQTNKRCVFHKQSLLWNMTKEELKDLSFRKLQKNAFESVWFGEQPYGLYAALPPEPLHLFNLGIVERLPESLFQRLSQQHIAAMDRHVAFICTHYSKQSSRNFPNIDTFSNGVSEAKRLSAKEKLARIFCIYLALISSDFMEIVVDSKGRCLDEILGLTGDITQKEYNNWIDIFEQTLLLSSWIYCDSHPKVFFKGGRKSIVAKRIVKYMNKYKKCAPRSEGNGLKILKFHQLSHLWWVIRLFGSLLNVDGARGESNNQHIAKAVGKTTQQHHQTLNYQTACNYFKREALMKSIQNNVLDQNSTSEPKEHTVPTYPQFTGSKFQLSFDYKSSTIRVKWMSYKLRHRECRFPNVILNSIYNKLQYYNGGEVGRRIITISGFTELKIADNGDVVTYRANPSFRSNKNWHDWAMLNWIEGNNEGSNDITTHAAQILMFLDIGSITYEDHLDNQCHIEHNVIPWEHVAFIHSTDAKKPIHTTPTKGKNVYTTRGYRSLVAQWFDMENIYRMVDVNNISSDCFIIIDKKKHSENNSIPGSAEKVVMILPTNEWCDRFIDYSDKLEKDRASCLNDETISASDNVYQFEN